jgi:hypothetical protein
MVPGLGTYLKVQRAWTLADMDKAPLLLLLMEPSSMMLSRCCTSERLVK